MSRRPLIVVATGLVAALAALVAVQLGSDEPAPPDTTVATGAVEQASPTTVAVATSPPVTTAFGTTTRTPATTRTPLTSAPHPLAASVIASERGPDGPVTSASDGFHGSGCLAGFSDLSDGLWFGHLMEHAIAPAATTVTFDLACRTDGKGFFFMENNSFQTRELAIGPETVFVFDSSRNEPKFYDLESGAAAISDRLSVHPEAGWGWALLESGALTEFLMITSADDYRNATSTDEIDAQIPGLLYSGDGVAIATDGFDGNGCSPPGATLGDGLWFGSLQLVGLRQVDIDLACHTSDPAKWGELGLDPTTIEDNTWVEDGSDAHYRIGVAAEAKWHLTNVDLSLLQTSLRNFDPRLHHLMDSSIDVMGWLRVEDGRVVEVFQFFEA